MKYTKMHGAGNDFIVVNNMDCSIPKEQYSVLASRLCTRRMSIGADGLMIVEQPTEGGDYRMAFYNSDGSIGEMCGNGARCIARYGYEKNLAGDIQKIETTAGLVTGERITKRQFKVRLNDVTKMVLDVELELGSKSYKCAYVELGNPPLPHVVVEIPNLADKDQDEMKKLGRELRYHSAFPKGANVNFCEVVGENEVNELTYERGVEDFTYACGTGTGATVAVLTQKGLVNGKNVKVSMAGGELFITINKSGERIKDIYLTGPTNIVAEGDVLDEDLNLWRRT